MTLPQTIQQLIETAYVTANGDLRPEDGPVALEDLYTRADIENNDVGDSLLCFLLNELVFDCADETVSDAVYADVVRHRLETIMDEVSAVYITLYRHLSERSS